jgi:hypothetical protein
MLYEYVLVTSVWSSEQISGIPHPLTISLSCFWITKGLDETLESIVKRSRFALREYHDQTTSNQMTHGTAGRGVEIQRADCLDKNVNKLALMLL